MDTRRLASSDDGRRFHVEIVRRATDLVGRLRVSRDGAAAASREVVAPTCDEVVEALAFLCTVDLEWQPAFARSPERSGAVVSLHDAGVVAAENRRSRDPRHWELGARAAATLSMVGPGPSAGAEAYGGFAWPREGSLAPDLRVVALGTFGDIAADSTTRSAALSGRLVLLAGGVQASVVRVSFSDVVELRPTFAVLAGGVHGDGSSVPGGRTSTQVWLAAVPAFRFGVVISRHAVLEAEVGASFGIVRNRFYFEPDRTLYAAPLVGGVAAIGIGLEGP